MIAPGVDASLTILEGGGYEFGSDLRSERERPLLIGHSQHAARFALSLRKFSHPPGNQWRIEFVWST